MLLAVLWLCKRRIDQPDFVFPFSGWQGVVLVPQTSLPFHLPFSVAALYSVTTMNFRSRSAAAAMVAETAVGAED